MRRAQRRKYHYIYKTECKTTGGYYYGMHSTDDLNDGYVGSGKRLWHSINKHGKENHVCEKLEFLENRKKLREREARIVNEDLIQDPSCMNIMNGGGGGKISDEQQRKRSSAGGRALALKIKNDKEYAKKHSELSSKEMKKKHKLGKIKYDTFTGKSHSEESKRKIGLANSITQKGEKNSQFGSKWITNGIEKKKLKKDQFLPIGWRYGQK